MEYIMKVGNVLRLFDVAQHVHLLFVRHSVPNLHLQSNIYDNRIFKKKNFTREQKVLNMSFTFLLPCVLFNNIFMTCLL